MATNETPATGQEWTTLNELPEGALFETESGVLAVKSEYHYTGAGAIQCILLASGEYAHFCQDNGISESARAYRHNATKCREIDPAATIRELRAALHEADVMLRGVMALAKQGRVRIKTDVLEAVIEQTTAALRAAGGGE